MKNLKHYLFPFLDYFLALIIGFLFTALFGSWFSFRPFAIVFGCITTLIMCGMIYSRFWNLSRKNTRYNHGFSLKDEISFILPLTIFCALMVLIYILAENNIIPFENIVVKSYYTFPDNLPRVKVDITLLDRFNSIIRIIFIYFLAFMKKTHWYVLILAPFLILISALLGIKLGAENKEVLEGYVKITDKIKDKFNE